MQKTIKILATVMSVGACQLGLASPDQGLPTLEPVFAKQERSDLEQKYVRNWATSFWLISAGCHLTQISRYVENIQRINSVEPIYRDLRLALENIASYEAGFGKSKLEVQKLYMVSLRFYANFMNILSNKIEATYDDVLNGDTRQGKKREAPLRALYEGRDALRLALSKLGESLDKNKVTGDAERERRRATLKKLVDTEMPQFWEFPSLQTIWNDFEAFRKLQVPLIQRDLKTKDFDSEQDYFNYAYERSELVALKFALIHVLDFWKLVHPRARVEANEILGNVYPELDWKGAVVNPEDADRAKVLTYTAHWDGKKKNRYVSLFASALKKIKS